MSTIIIAEAGVNHNGDVELAKSLIDCAAASGADFVKFQTFKAEKLVSPVAKLADYQKQNVQTTSSQLDMLRKLELSNEAHKFLFDYCCTIGIGFLSTAFDLDSLDYLNLLGLPLFKIPSGEITNLPYLEKVGQFGKPVVMSTGMSELFEIEEALNVLKSTGLKQDQITILHCNTEYPTPYEDVNLLAMVKIREKFGVKTGYSDHTLGIEVPVAAVALGARVIEKHFTLDRQMEGPDHQASLTPDELREMVQAIRNIEVALGDGTKRISDSERKNLPLVRKSVFLANPVQKGQMFKLEDLVMMRPGDGISPMKLSLIIGKRASQLLQAGHKLTWNDVENA